MNQWNPNRNKIDTILNRYIVGWEIQDTDDFAIVMT